MKAKFSQLYDSAAKAGQGTETLLYNWDKNMYRITILSKNALHPKE